MLTPIPLHMPMGHGGLFLLLPGLFFLAFVALVFVMFARRGRFGPVRWAPGPMGDPRPHGAPGHPGGHRPPWAQPSPEEAALTILAERLARGDISPEEYLERSTVLRNARPTE